MRIPIYIDDSEAGELLLGKSGRWTTIDARVKDVGRVLRLYVYGERSYYLGVPVPEGEGLRLTRRLSPLEAEGFPREPRYAAEREFPAQRVEARRVLWLGGRPHYF